jgi:hypothetical protein
MSRDVSRVPALSKPTVPKSGLSLLLFAGAQFRLADTVHFSGLRNQVRSYARDETGVVSILKLRRPRQPNCLAEAPRRWRGPLPLSLSTMSPPPIAVNFSALFRCATIQPIRLTKSPALLPSGIAPPIVRSATGAGWRRSQFKRRDFNITDQPSAQFEDQNSLR